MLFGIPRDKLITEKYVKTNYRLSSAIQDAKPESLKTLSCRVDVEQRNKPWQGDCLMYPIIQ